MVDRLPGAFKRRCGVFDNLHHLAELPSAAGFHYHEIASLDIPVITGIKMVNLTDFLKTDTDNERSPIFILTHLSVWH